MSRFFSSYFTFETDMGREGHDRISWHFLKKVLFLVNSKDFLLRKVQTQVTQSEII